MWARDASQARYGGHRGGHIQAERLGVAALATERKGDDSTNGAIGGQGGAARYVADEADVLSNQLCVVARTLNK